jgi:hypothetical protein
LVENLNKQRPKIFAKLPLGSDVYKTTTGCLSEEVWSTQVGFCGSADLLGLRQAGLPEYESSYVAFSKTPGLLFLDKTKYIELLDEKERYQYVFVRPGGFGKSTFLNMLCSYYDIAAAATFQDVFGGLYIGNQPTPSLSRHLVLQLDLSMIRISGNLAATQTSFHTVINNVLRVFLEKYRNWIGDQKSDFDKIISPENASASLVRVLVCICWDKCLKGNFLIGLLDNSQKGRLYDVCWS